MRYVEAPERFDGPGPALFLGGGIMGCPDWQAAAVAMLSDHPTATVLNPRRASFAMADAAAAAEQVGWEHRHLHRADVILFWFPASRSVQPIALFELGVHATRGVPLAVGVDSGYPRRHDVALQLALARPGLPVHSTLAATVRAARTLLRP